MDGLLLNTILGIINWKDLKVQLSKYLLVVLRSFNLEALLRRIDYCYTFLSIANWEHLGNHLLE